MRCDRTGSAFLCACRTSVIFFEVMWPPRRSTLFPYTTLFRSRVRRDGARLEQRVGRGEPSQVAADGDLARIVDGTPGEPHPRLQVGATAPLRRVGLGVEEPLRSS